jgi:hypothetical protein
MTQPPRHDELSELLNSLISQGKQFLTHDDLEKIQVFLDREQEADPEQYIWKPPPNYFEDQTTYYVVRQGNVSWTGAIKKGEPLPPGAVTIRGPRTTASIEIVKEFLHPTTRLIAQDDALRRLAYAIDLQCFAYTRNIDVRQGRTQQSEAKRRADRIAEYTKRLMGPHADSARRQLREYWLEELDEGSEAAINWIMKDPEKAVDRILLLRRPLFNPWHECAKNLAITYVKLFGKLEQLTAEQACSKTGTLIYFLTNALEEITGKKRPPRPATIAKVLREAVQRSRGKKVPGHSIGVP